MAPTRALTADQRRWIVQEEQLAQGAVEAIAHARGDRPLPDPRAPYFAHLRLRVGQRTRDLLLGDRTLLDASRRITVVDFRTSPLAEVFFHFATGEDYEVEHEGRSLEGHVIFRRRVTFHEGRLVRVQQGDTVLARQEDQWRSEPATAPPELTPTTAPPPPLLDPAQQRAVDRCEDHGLLVLGTAGSGKTTVALHRADVLTREKPREVRPDRTLVVSPTRGLAALWRRLLDEQGQPTIHTVELDGWLVDHARQMLPEIPHRLSEDTPAGVIHFKRHPALQQLLPDFLQALAVRLVAELDRLYLARGVLTAAFAARGSGGLLQRLDRAGETWREQEPQAAPSAAELRAQVLQRLGTPVELLRELLQDRELLQRAVAASRGALGESLVEQMVQRTRLQALATEDERYAHVSARRRQTLDGRSLEVATPEELAGTLDVEDHALLLELHCLVQGAAALQPPTPLDHLVVDEVQEMAPIELARLGAQRRHEGWLTAAGDGAQQLDPGAAWSGWDPAMQALNAGDHYGGYERTHLNIGYRCTREIADLAHGLLGDQAPAEPPTSVRQGAAVLRSVVSSAGERTVLLQHALSTLLTHMDHARVGIITRDEDTARRCHAELSRVLGCRLVTDGDFSFGPGVELAAVSQVRGLEFDYVILPDVTPAAYAQTPRARRRLHVAVTRALQQLWIMSIGPMSKLVA